MNYYQEPTSYYHGNYGRDSEVRDYNQTSMFGDIPPLNRADENGLDYDPDYDEEVNKLLEEVEEELNEDTAELKIEVDKTVKADRDRYEDFYDEFPPEEPAVKISTGFLKIFEKKQQEAIARLKSLSLLVSYASPRAWEHIKRIQQDHHTPFCKLNPLRHPPMNKPWKNYWKFKCATKCNVDPPEPNHAHTTDCEVILLEHNPTLVSTKTKNLIPMEFPEHVMRTVEMFQDFINKTSKENPYLYSNEIPDTVYERPTWCEVILKTNYKNEIMAIISGKGVTPLIKPLKRLFEKGPGRTLNVTSLWCHNMRCSQKKHKFPPTFLCGSMGLRDKIGPITVNYTSENNITFNSIEAELLGRIMMEYLSPTPETTVIDIGCNFGVLSLMLATKCDKVIGLNTLDNEIQLAEKLKLSNGLHNASFITCTPKDVHTKCSSLVKKCISVAVLNLSTTFGKSPDVMKALRNLPSLWRVALYGTFKKEYQKHITILTSSDHHMGEEFLPMQGCVLEKSPSNPQEFNIVVVFERKSLIEPSIDLIGSAPTVNIKEDLDCKYSKPVVIPDIKTSEIVGRGYGKFRQYDSPALPKNDKDKDIHKDVKPVIEPQQLKDTEVTNLLPADYGKPVPKKPVIDIAKLYDPTPNPLVNRQLKKIYDSPLLPKSNDSTNVIPKSDNRSSIKIEPTTPSTLSTDPRCDFLDELKPSLPISTDPRCDFLDELKPSLPISTDPRCDFLDESKPSLPSSTNSQSHFLNKSKLPFPISTDPRCDFLNEAINFNVKQEPFDQKKVPVIKKERNFGTTKPRNDKRFDCSFIKKEKWSTSSQDSNSKSPPPVKKEPLNDTRTQTTSFGRALKTETIESRLQSIPTNIVYETPHTFKTETVNFTVPIKCNTQFHGPPLPKGLPPDYSARPPNYIAPPPDFSVPPPGFNAFPNFSVVPPPLPKVEPPRSFIEKEEGELSSDSTNDSFKQISDEDTQPDVLLDAIIKPEPMDLDDDDNNDEEENVPEDQSNSTVQNNVFVKPEVLTSKQEPIETFPVVHIKSEPIDPHELPDNINDLTSTDEFPDFPVRIKTEPVDRDEVATTSATSLPTNVKQERTSPIIKSEELVDTDKVATTTMTSLPTNIKRERASPIINSEYLVDTDKVATTTATSLPTNVKLERASPIINPEDLMNMPTPIHNPAALAERDRDSVSPPPASANFKTIDGFEFSVEPNQSYLVGMVGTIVKKEPGLEEKKSTSKEVTSKSEICQPVKQEKIEESSEKKEENPPVIRVKKLDTIFGTCNSEDEEIKILNEKKSKKVKKEKSRSKSRSESKKSLKREKEKNLDPDIRLLLEEKKMIKKILKRRKSKYDRSLSPSPDRRSKYRSPSRNWDRDRSPPTAYKRTNRSSPYEFDKWLKHSSSSDKYLSRSPSPRERWARRSPYSPSPSRRWNRSPSPSSESRFRRSPLSPSNSRFKRSPRSRERQFRRSSTSPSSSRFKRLPHSPSERRSRRSSNSPSARRFQYSPPSPSSRRWRRSPSSSSIRKFKRSPSPYDQANSMYEGKTKPPVRKYSQSAYGDYVSSRYKWTRTSPTGENETFTRSSSPNSESKKRKTSPLENSELKKSTSESKIGDQWDIPAKGDLSSFSDSTTSSPDKRKRIKRETSPTDSLSSLSSISTTTPKVENTS